jgi:hypothetical protein
VTGTPACFSSVKKVANISASRASRAQTWH